MLRAGSTSSRGVACTRLGASWGGWLHSRLRSANQHAMERRASRFSRLRAPAAWQRRSGRNGRYSRSAYRSSRSCRMRCLSDGRRPAELDERTRRAAEHACLHSAMMWDLPLPPSGVLNMAGQHGLSAHCLDFRSLQKGAWAPLLVLRVLDPYCASTEGTQPVLQGTKRCLHVVSNQCRLLHLLLRSAAVHS
jgi:hypothetical protein